MNFVVVVTLAIFLDSNALFPPTTSFAVMRVSMEEERLRQEQQAAAAAAATPTDGAPPAAAPEPLDLGAPPEPLDLAPEAAAGGDEMDEDELLQQALALSMNAAGDEGAGEAETADVGGMAGMDEEMQLALQMSMQMEPSTGPSVPPATAAPAAAAPAPTAAAAPAAPAAALYDPAIVNSMLATLPGVDPSDPRIQAALAQIQAKQDSEKKDEKK